MSVETQDKLYEKFKEAALSKHDLSTIAGIQQVIRKIVDLLYLMGHFMTEMNEDLKVLQGEVKKLRRTRGRRKKNE